LAEALPRLAITTCVNARWRCQNEVLSIRTLGKAQSRGWASTSGANRNKAWSESEMCGAQAPGGALRSHISQYGGITPEKPAPLACDLVPTFSWFFLSAICLDYALEIRAVKWVVTTREFVAWPIWN